MAAAIAKLDALPDYLSGRSQSEHALPVLEIVIEAKDGEVGGKRAREGAEESCEDEVRKEILSYVLEQMRVEWSQYLPNESPLPSVMTNKLVVHVTKEGAALLQSKEAAAHGGKLPPKPESLASRVMSAVDSGEPFVTETEEEARRVLEAETEAQIIREALAPKATHDPMRQLDLCSVKANTYAVSEFMRVLRDEHIEREVYLGRLQASAFKDEAVDIPIRLAEGLTKVLEIKAGTKEGVIGKAEAIIMCGDAPAVMFVAEPPPDLPE